MRKLLDKIKKKIIGIFFGRKIAIISNNCVGAVLAHDFKMRFNSPTVNLQILPCDFTKFCINLEHYVSMDLIEIKHESNLLSNEQATSLTNTYGGGGRNIQNLDFPIAKCGDIVILFQHYKTFEEAKEKWDSRKIRLSKSKKYFLFVANSFDEKYINEFENGQLPLKRKAIILQNDKSNRISNFKTKLIQINVPHNEHLINMKNSYQKFYETGFNVFRWIILGYFNKR